MSRVILGIVIGLALAAAGMIIFVKYPEVTGFLGLPEARQEREFQTPTEESFVRHDAGGQDVVRLDLNEQARIGLQVASLTASTAPSEVRGFGRVLDPAPLAALVTESVSAEAAWQASSKEYERVKSLFAQGQNVSARELETAEAALIKDRAARESVRLRLLAGWGQELASRPELPAFVAALAARQAVLLRVDVPLGERPKAAPLGGHVARMDTPEDMLAAEMIGPAPTTDLQTQTVGYLLVAKTDLLAPGAVVIAWLAVPGAPLQGVQVPEAALLRHQGRAWVYVAAEDAMFQRRPVTLNHPLEEGWLIVGELKPDQRIVVRGAQMLLSEELKSSLSLRD